MCVCVCVCLEHIVIHYNVYLCGLNGKLVNGNVSKIVDAKCVQSMSSIAYCLTTEY